MSSFHNSISQKMCRIGNQILHVPVPYSINTNYRNVPVKKKRKHMTYTLKREWRMQRAGMMREGRMQGRRM